MSDDNEALIQLLETNENQDKQITALKAENTQLKEKINELTLIIQSFTDQGKANPPHTKPTTHVEDVPMQMDEESKENNNQVLFNNKPPAEKFKPSKNALENSKVKADSEGYVTIWFDTKATGLCPYKPVDIVGEFTEYKKVPMNHINNGLYFIRCKFGYLPCKQKFVFVQKDLTILSKMYEVTKSSSSTGYPMNYIFAFEAMDLGSLKVELSSLKSVMNSDVSEEEREAFADIIRRETAAVNMQNIKPMDIFVEAGSQAFHQIVTKNQQKIKLKRLTDQNGMKLADNNNVFTECTLNDLVNGAYEAVSSADYTRLMQKAHNHEFDILYMVEGNEVIPVYTNKEIDMKTVNH
jgi:hypothetical protein